MVTRMPAGEREPSLGSASATSFWNANEKRRVLSILATTADGELAAPGL